MREGKHKYTIMMMNKMLTIGVGWVVGVGEVRRVKNSVTLSQPPVTTLPLSEDIAIAPLRMTALICAAVAWGYSAL